MKVDESHLKSKESHGSETKPGVNTVEMRHWPSLAIIILPQAFIIPDTANNQSEIRTDLNEPISSKYCICIMSTNQQ